MIKENQNVSLEPQIHQEIKPTDQVIFLQELFKILKITWEQTNLLSSNPISLLPVQKMLKNGAKIIKKTTVLLSTTKYLSEKWKLCLFDLFLRALMSISYVSDYTAARGINYNILLSINKFIEKHKNYAAEYESLLKEESESSFLNAIKQRLFNKRLLVPIDEYLNPEIKFKKGGITFPQISSTTLEFDHSYPIRLLIGISLNFPTVKNKTKQF